MRKLRAGEVFAITTAAAVVGLGATLYNKAEKLEHSVGIEMQLTRDGRLDPVLRSAAIDAGKMALKRAVEDGDPTEITPDKYVKGGINITVTGDDDNQAYGMIVGMRTKKDGEPDPRTTYEVLEDEYYGDSSNVKNECSILGGGALGGQHWNAMYQEFSAQEQDKPETRIDTVQTPSLGVAKNLAKMIRLEANLISILPPSEEIQPPGSDII
jgi:hypothetical protein